MQTSEPLVVDIKYINILYIYIYPYRVGRWYMKEGGKKGV